MTGRWIDYHSEALHDRAYALLMADAALALDGRGEEEEEAEQEDDDEHD